MVAPISPAPSLCATASAASPVAPVPVTCRCSGVAWRWLLWSLKRPRLAECSALANADAAAEEDDGKEEKADDEDKRAEWTEAADVAAAALVSCTDDTDDD